MDSEFPRQIYEEAKRLIADGGVRPLVAREPGPDCVDGAAGQLVYDETGTETTCSEFSSRIQNHVAAVTRMRVAMDARGGAEGSDRGG